MLELAIGGQQQLVVSRLEIDRGGVSFTVDTLEALRTDQPDRELFLILGADSLVDLPNWREPGRIAELATLAVCGRPGFEVDVAPLAGIVDSQRIDAIRRHRVEMPLIELSSRAIRRRIAEGLSIRYQTPRAVEKYIEAHALYRDAAAAETAADRPNSPCAKRSF
jgi:nicotinate-nucleotide adenylyltransferase